MHENYHFGNIRVFLTESFSLEELFNLCFDTPELQDVCEDRPANPSVGSYARLMVEYADKRGLLETLLQAAQEQNPNMYARYEPRFHIEPIVDANYREESSLESSGSVLPDNNLGKGLMLGGLYRDIPLKIAAHDWAEYGIGGWVRSGWLFIPQRTASHAVTFFKVHVLNDRTGYIHLADVSAPAHTIWLVTSGGLKIEKEFHYVTYPVDVWHF